MTEVPPPFVFPSIPQADAELGVSGLQINNQSLELYLSRLVEALESLDNRLTDLESRVEALESP
jgi:hypothetical protein